MRDSNPDLYVAGAMLHQLCYQATGSWSLHGSMISLLIVDICDQMKINKISQFADLCDAGFESRSGQNFSGLSTTASVT